MRSLIPGTRRGIDAARFAAAQATARHPVGTTRRGHGDALALGVDKPEAIAERVTISETSEIFRFDAEKREL